MWCVCGGENFYKKSNLVRERKSLAGYRDIADETFRNPKKSLTSHASQPTHSRADETFRNLKSLASQASQPTHSRADETFRIRKSLVSHSPIHLVHPLPHPQLSTLRQTLDFPEKSKKSHTKFPLSPLSLTSLTPRSPSWPDRDFRLSRKK